MTLDFNLEIKVIASGSKGNCYYLNDGSTALLLECGIKFKDIQKALNFNLSDIEGVLVSHEHDDHAKSVKKLYERGLDFYMSPGTANALNINAFYPYEVKKGEFFRIGTWKVFAFDLQHDAKEPLGFVLTSDHGYRVLFATDTYVIPYSFKGVTHMLIECNYDNDTLQQSIREGLPEFRYKRLLKSHNSLESVLTYLERTDKSRLEEIHLIHLSEGNANKQKMIYAVYDRTLINTYAHGGL